MTTLARRALLHPQTREMELLSRAQAHDAEFRAPPPPEAAAERRGEERGHGQEKDGTAPAPFHREPLY